NNSGTLRGEIHELGRIELHAQLQVFTAYHKWTITLSMKIVKLEVHFGSVLHRPKYIKLLHFLHKLRRFGNRNGCFEFVTSQHPQLDASILEAFQCSGNTVLQSIFDSC